MARSVWCLVAFAPFYAARGVPALGSRENTNGLLRQFMPKGADLGDARQTWLNDVAALMNNRPRKTLGWRTPAEAMADEIAAFRSTVALETGI